MRPIEKFADIECIYNFADKEEQYTEYVWKLAMSLAPAQEEDEPFECSYAMPIFKTALRFQKPSVIIENIKRRFLF